MRHDAKQCREHARSEVVRHSFGLLTPQERDEQARREEAVHRAAAKDATQGPELFESGYADEL